MCSIELSNAENKFIFACRSNDLNLKCTKPWFYEDSVCICCLSATENIRLIIELSELLGKNELLSYIHNIEDLEGSLDKLIYLLV